MAGKKSKAPATKNSDSESEEAPVKPTKKQEGGNKRKAGDKEAKKNIPKEESGSESENEEEKAAIEQDDSSDEDNKPEAEGEDENEAEENEEKSPAVKKPRTESDGGDWEVFLDRCPQDVDEDAVKELFKDCGSVLNVKWLNGRDGSFSGRGFVKFDSEDAVNEALKLDGADLNGTSISIGLPKNKSAGGKPGGSGGDKTVFLGRLSDNVTEEDIRSLFAECGEISEVRWGQRDGNFAGFGFCEFADAESVQKAVALNGTDVAGRAINIDIAGGKSGGGGGGRGGGGGFGGRGGGGFGGRGGGGRGGGGFGGGRGGGFGGRGGGGFGGRGGGFGGRGGGGRGGGFGGGRGGGGRGGGGRGGGGRGSHTRF